MKEIWDDNSTWKDLPPHEVAQEVVINCPVKEPFSQKMLYVLFIPSQDASCSPPSHYLHSLEKIYIHTYIDPNLFLKIPQTMHLWKKVPLMAPLDVTAKKIVDSCCWKC